VIADVVALANAVAAENAERAAHLDPVRDARRPSPTSDGEA
jgi:hypothetical protein